jgi:hypothetical protein
MGINHKRTILVLRDEYPKYYEANRPEKVTWGSDFAKYDFRDARKSGIGANEEFVLSTEIIIDSKSIPVTFKENIEGELTIEVDGKAIYTVKRSGHMSQGLLDAFTLSIKEHLS